MIQSLTKQKSNIQRGLIRLQSTLKELTNSVYVLPMFPYPSGKIHIGHVRVFSVSDCITRYKKMQGFNVFQPMGWDAFGLPAENAAMEHGIPPAQWTEKNINEMRSQVKSLDCSLNWEAEINTSNPDYYRWTQWLFLKLWEKGYVSQKDGLVNWDPVDKTVLANEQVDEEGKSWRSGALVEKRKLRQWYVLTTRLSEDLLQGLHSLENWPQLVKTAQSKWIGKSQGAEFDFQLTDQKLPLTVFTTRPETLMGVSFLGLSSTHPLTLKYAENNEELQRFLNTVSKTPYQVGEGNVDGYELPISAYHPVTHSIIKVFVSNYVLADYGAGAIMGVPAHDNRDAAFAMQYSLPIQQVIDKSLLINSGSWTGMTVSKAVNNILTKAKQENWGRFTTRYRLRDWLVSRQRYWGAPIPAIHCDYCGVVPVPYEDLPLTLPQMTDENTNRMSGDEAVSPLGRFTKWKIVKCPQCGNEHATRDCDTLDTFMDSSWHFYRYLDPHNSSVFCNKDALCTYPQVDYYIGGSEHSIMHLLYARFIARVLNREGITPSPEPFNHLITQGMVLSETFIHPTSGAFIPSSLVQKQGNEYRNEQGELIDMKYVKMSKSKYNGVDPVEVVNKYKSDTVRIAMLMQCPIQNSFLYNPTIMSPAKELLQKVDTVCSVCTEPTLINKKVKLDIGKLDLQYNKILHDMELFEFHNVLSSITIMLNTLQKAPYSKQYMEYIKCILCFLYPFAPVKTEECWNRLIDAKRIDSNNLLKVQHWPSKARSLNTMAIIQINGKMKKTISLDCDLSNENDHHRLLSIIEKIPEVKSHINFFPKDIKIVFKANRLIVNYLS